MYPVSFSKKINSYAIGIVLLVRNDYDMAFANDSDVPVLE